MFYRLGTDGTQTEIGIAGTFGGPTPSSCWLIGGGPSLQQMEWDRIVKSPIPKMCINLAGSGFFRPTMWTAYDPSSRFHRSIYLDPGVMKFVHRRRAMDIVPETTYKVCDCPQVYFFDRDGQRGYTDFVSQGHRAIVDWADSMVQAIDILFHLGFRRMYLAGCEMRIHPTSAQLELAERMGVSYQAGELLGDFLKRCSQSGIDHTTLDQTGGTDVYHFPEQKQIRSAANTDFHYFRIVQYLRLSRRSMSLAGLQLISTTPESRLNDHFPEMTLERACEEIKTEVGDPDLEDVTGRYRLTEARLKKGVGPMRDFRPHHWGEHSSKAPSVKKTPAIRPVAPRDLENEEILIEGEGFAPAKSPQAIQDELQKLVFIPDEICEEG